MAKKILVNHRLLAQQRHIFRRMYPGRLHLTRWQRLKLWLAWWLRLSRLERQMIRRIHEWHG